MNHPISPIRRPGCRKSGLRLQKHSRPCSTSFTPSVTLRFQVGYFYVEGSLEKIAFAFGPVSLLVLADEDDDSISIRLANADAVKLSPDSDVSHAPMWRHLIGKPLGWGYIVVNQQGYCDGILLAFGDVRPTRLLQVWASSIVVKVISES